MRLKSGVVCRLSQAMLDHRDIEKAGGAKIPIDAKVKMEDGVQLPRTAERSSPRFLVGLASGFDTGVVGVVIGLVKSDGPIRYNRPGREIRPVSVVILEAIVRVISPRGRVAERPDILEVEIQTQGDSFNGRVLRVTELRTSSASGRG